MRLFGLLCHFGLHRWQGDADSIAKRYRHNTWWDKTKNHLGDPRALVETCKCCGKKRRWSFNRGKWRDYSGEERSPAEADTSAAWQTTHEAPMQGSATATVADPVVK